VLIPEIIVVDVPRAVRRFADCEAGRETGARMYQAR
jgi:hypothetical protein